MARSDGTGGTKAINVKHGIRSSGKVSCVRWKNQGEDSFVAFRLNGIAAGTYDINFSVDDSYSGGAAANIYVMPASELPAAAGDVLTKLASMTPAGKVGCYHQGGTKDATSVQRVAFTGSSDDSYVVVFQTTENAAKLAINKSTSRLVGITLTASSGAADTPATTPSTPAQTDPVTEPNTEPSSGDHTDHNDVSMNVNWEVAIEDPVSQSYFTHTATGVVNGHDYLYLGLRGGKLVIYDIDEKKQVNAINTGNDQPCYILVDENGSVWITGANGMVCYNPFTDTYDTATKKPTASANGWTFPVTRRTASKAATADLPIRMATCMPATTAPVPSPVLTQRPRRSSRCSACVTPSLGSAVCILWRWATTRHSAVLFPIPALRYAGMV